MLTRRRFTLSTHFCCLAVLLALNVSVLAGGGGITTNDDRCVLSVGFYEVHLTVYQPDIRGNEEFCIDLPDKGQTIFVLNYLHASLKEVPVDFRIIKNVTGLGKLVRWEDIQQLGDLENHTVFYSASEIEPGGSYQAQYGFPGKGDYIGIVTAGHPSNDKTYRGMFAFSVNSGRYGVWLICLSALLVVGFLVYAYRAKVVYALKERRLEV
jgi:hypothetical protein